MGALHVINIYFEASVVALKRRLNYRCIEAIGLKQRKKYEQLPKYAG